MDGSATHSQFESRLLLIDKSIEFPINVFLKSLLLTAQIYFAYGNGLMFVKIEFQ